MIAANSGKGRHVQADKARDEHFGKRLERLLAPCPATEGKEHLWSAGTYVTAIWKDLIDSGFASIISLEHRPPFPILRRRKYFLAGLCHPRQSVRKAPVFDDKLIELQTRLLSKDSDTVTKMIASLRGERAMVKLLHHRLSGYFASPRIPAPVVHPKRHSKSDLKSIRTLQILACTHVVGARAKQMHHEQTSNDAPLLSKLHITMTYKSIPALNFTRLSFVTYPKTVA